MQKIIFLKGLPASGKSTWAKDYIKNNPTTKRVNKDDLRSMLDDSLWSKSNESNVLKVQKAIVTECLYNGYDVIVDNTHLNPKHEDVYRELCAKMNCKFAIQFFDVPVEECIERDKKRPNPVGSKVILEMYNQYLKKDPPVIEYNVDLPDAIICDIDGTLARAGSRDVYDTEKCLSDSPIMPVVNILDRYKKDTVIILVSGRDAAFRSLTEEWLNLFNIPHHFLFMRPEGDRRRDDIVKREIYQDYIAGRYNIKFVIDDRKRVKRMWVNEGLFVLDVNQTDAEF